MTDHVPEILHTSGQPPGGLWYFRRGADSCSSPFYDMVIPEVERILRRQGSSEDPASALAAFMCPLMPPWFCRGTPQTTPVVRPEAALASAGEYVEWPVETADTIISRMRECQSCPQFRKDFCVHCLGLDDRVYAMFGGRRRRLPGDASSGTCACARTLTMIVASVVYPSGSEVWKGTPATCWRNKK